MRQLLGVVRVNIKKIFLAIKEEVLERLIPLTPEDYKMKFDKEQKEIEELKMAAGVDVKSSAPINDFTESLRRAAGIR